MRTVFKDSKDEDDHKNTYRSNAKNNDDKISFSSS